METEDIKTNVSTLSQQFEFRTTTNQMSTSDSSSGHTKAPNRCGAMTSRRFPTIPLSRYLHHPAAQPLFYMSEVFSPPSTIFSPLSFICILVLETNILKKNRCFLFLCALISLDLQSEVMINSGHPSVQLSRVVCRALNETTASGTWRSMTQSHNINLVWTRPRFLWGVLAP